MSKSTDRKTAPLDEGSVEHRLARLLEAPFLARVVPHLPPETLHQLIRHRGLDACGELVTSATSAQLNALLDLDLWQHARPGRDDRFDADRFGEWLEMLAEIGELAAARTISTLDTTVVVAGLSRYVRVFDPGIFEPVAQSDDERIDRHEAMHEGDASAVAEAAPHDSSGGPVECEIGGYVVRARRLDTWDAIVAVLLALDSRHPDCFHAVMRGCRSLSNSTPEIDGLNDLLMAPEQLLHDVALGRERRRSQRGYASAADARAFLDMARRPEHAQSISVNPIAVAYFRDMDEEPESPGEMAPAGPAPESADAGESIGAVVELLSEAGMMPGRPRALIEGADQEARAAGVAQLRRLMACADSTDTDAYAMRSRELAFLANTLVAGCSVQARSFTLPEASDAAAATCNLGLEYWPGCDDVPLPDEWLVDHDLLMPFAVGWSTLHQDVCLFAADQLIATLGGVDCVDSDLSNQLRALRRTLVKERAAGTPWRAREAAEVLAILDTTAWIGVLGLLDECPILPAALAAVVDGRTTPVSPTEFAFISTRAQIEEVRVFVRKLPGLLTQ